MILGIDLAGSQKRSTGLCFLKDDFKADCFTVHTDREIIGIVKKLRPIIIAIDAPLSMPKGRRSLKKKSKIHFRECDRELWKLRIKFFPITLGPMRMLTERGIRLKKKFESLGFKVIEVYPGATQDLLGIPRKQRGLEKLKQGLEKLGIKFLKQKLTGDELDAATAAYTGWLYLKGKYKALGNREEGQIIVPETT